MGEGSAACMLGLFTGLCVLVMQKYLTEEALHQVCRMPVPTLSPAWVIGICAVCLFLQATRMPVFEAFPAALAALSAQTRLQAGH